MHSSSIFIAGGATAMFICATLQCAVCNATVLDTNVFQKSANPLVDIPQGNNPEIPRVSRTLTHLYRSPCADTQSPWQSLLFKNPLNTFMFWWRDGAGSSPNAFCVLNAGSLQQCVLSELLSGTIITSVQRCFRERGPAPCVDRKGSFYDNRNTTILFPWDYTLIKKNILMNSVLLDATKITPTAALREHFPFGRQPTRFVLHHVIQIHTHNIVQRLCVSWSPLP